MRITPDGLHFSAFHYIRRILHSSTISVGLAQARPNYTYDFSASNNFIIVVIVVVPRVCVYLAFRSFLPHVHLHPDVRVHRGIENSFI